MKQSFAWWCFEGKGVDDVSLIKAAKEIGYEGVDLVPDDKLSLAHDFGLTFCAQGGHKSIENGLNNPVSHSRIEQEIMANLELAKKWDVKNLIVFSGSRRYGLTDKQGAEQTASCLARVAKAAESVGVTLAIEFLNSRVDHPEYQGDKSDWIVKVCQEVGSPRVKMLYDIYHAQIMEGDLIRTIQHQQEFISHYHTAGNPGRNDLDDVQEISYVPVFKAIARTGFDGFICHEFIPKGDPIKALKTAFEYTNAAVA